MTLGIFGFVAQHWRVMCRGKASSSISGRTAVQHILKVFEVVWE